MSYAFPLIFNGRADFVIDMRHTKQSKIPFCSNWAIALSKARTS